MKNEKNILIFSREYPPNIVGGTSMVARSTAEGLQKLGHNVTVISSYVGTCIMRQIINGVRVIFVNDSSIYMNHSTMGSDILRHHKKVLDISMKEIDEKPDIVLLPDLFSFPEAYISAQKYNIPLINILLQDFDKMIIYDKDGSHKVTNQVNGSEMDLLGVEEKSLLKSNINVFISNALSDSIIKHYNLERNMCRRIYLGIKEGEVELKENVNYDKFRNSICSANKKLFGTIGRLVPVKGFDYLLKAFKIVNEYDSDTFLYIMGTGPEDKYLRCLIKELGLEESVKIFYEPNREKVVSYMNVCDYAVVPSIWESFCYVAAEFMAMKKPLIVNGVDSLNELVVNGESGLICPVIEEGKVRRVDVELLAKLMISVLKNPNRALQMAEKAKERVNQLFREEIYAKNLNILIMETINKYGDK